MYPQKPEAQAPLELTVQAAGRGTGRHRLPKSSQYRHWELNPPFTLDFHLPPFEESRLLYGLHPAQGGLPLADRSRPASPSSTKSVVTDHLHLLRDEASLALSKACQHTMET